MVSALSSLFVWLPVGLRFLVNGAIVIFFLITLLRLWIFIKDLIPFL